MKTRRRGAGRVKYLRHQDAVANGQRTPAAGVADYHVCWAARADRRAVYDQRIGARCGAALVEHRVEPQRAAIGDEGAGAGNPGLPRAGDHEHVASDGVALQIDYARVGERRATPIKWPCNGPPSAIALLGLPSGRYCPVLSSVVAPVTAGSASVPLLVKLLFGPVAEVRYGHPERIAHAVPIGVGEVPQVEQAIVDDAVIAADELHEAGDGAVVDDAVLLLRKNGLPATARSDSAPMLPLLVRVAVPPDEPRITPAAGRPKVPDRW